ncbi:hypothetical protein PIB30_102960, partial [Stylosanthes scabra]|nr:hypothetical protein [Stylosanthes scabra]
RDNTILLQHKNEKSKKEKKTDVTESDLTSMYTPPYPPPFAAPILSTPLTDALMEKLKPPVAKTHRAESNKVVINEKVNTKRPKESPRKHVAGSKLHSPNSSPSEIPISVLSRILNDCPKDFERGVEIRGLGQEGVPSMTNPMAWPRVIAEKGLM